MDEFLALMEDGGGSALPSHDDDNNNNEAIDDPDQEYFMPCESPTATSHSDTTSGSFRSPLHQPHSSSLFSTHHDRSGDSKKSSSTKTTSRNPQERPLQASSSKVATVGVDDKLGIRMMNRLVSSLDLLDLITSTSPFYSPAQIGAMSLQGLCRLLLDPPPSIIDPATVQGRTNLVTVGIVFENSGTITSSKGGAFCILKLGSNLQTGPCLAVFLFGSAYTKYCRSCQAGQVVAICNPKLLPARMDDKSRQDTSVSLSVHDQSQLIHVAKARDYGICQGKTRGKTADGSWSDTAGYCKHYVDKRLGDYCAFHSKQQKQLQQLQQQALGNRMANASQMRAIGGLTSHSNQGSKMMQQFKAQKLQQQQQQPSHQGRATNSMVPNSNRFLGSGMMASRGNFDTTKSIAASSTNMSKPVSQPNRFLEKSSTIKTPLATTTNNANPYMAKTAKGTDGAAGIISGIPMHMKKQDPKVIPRNQVAANSNASHRGNQSSTNKTGDWMMDATSQRKSVSQSLTKYMPGADRQRTRKISTVGGGFDGSVVVPKPSQLFTKNARLMSDKIVPTFGTTRVEEDTSEDRIKEQQSLLAAKLREQKSGSIGQDKMGSVPSQVNPFTAKKSSSSGNSFLDSIHIDNVEAVLAAKSQFASEADAEDYIKNRSRVVELEKLETKQVKRKASSEAKENQKIICEWVCRTCPNAPRFAKRPTQCISSGHQVKRDRMLKQGKTKEEERALLNEKEPENGGIILGRGLEWSFNRFNQLS